MIKCIPSLKYMEFINKNVPLKNGEIIIEKLGRNENNIIKILQENPQITQVELAKKLNITRKTIQREMSKLKENEIIKRVGTKKSGYWEVKIKNIGNSLNCTQCQGH